ncbi:hypothetical protein CSC67_02985 [Pusillimonas caeni]|uniref:PepSY-associated TM helix domain-containing protein n=1 Tax=Pusillimonas caeni TaxID=1348472 RepID=UPI000E59C97C|nr:PepSY-associated TM helix domain-containing protein [Pusillimonas caeni]TFL15705.1 hypothetical protein CSC67_02985 [Pusillimonas caeni]
MKASSSPQRRSYWLKTLHQWHWMSAALSLAGLIVFAATGITLNNAAWIEASPKVETLTATMPEEVLAVLAERAGGPDKGPLPARAEQWLDQQLNIHIRGRAAEYSPDEIYVGLPEPGADAWLVVSLPDGEVEYERSARGWVAYFNDLHKGRNTGAAWSWFIDVFAAACLVFAVTGLFLMTMHAANRKATWPLTGLGVLIPLILMLLWVH